MTSLGSLACIAITIYRRQRQKLVSLASWSWSLKRSSSLLASFDPPCHGRVLANVRSTYMRRQLLVPRVGKWVGQLSYRSHVLGHRCSNDGEHVRQYIIFARILADGRPLYFSLHMTDSEFNKDIRDSPKQPFEQHVKFQSELAQENFTVSFLRQQYYQSSATSSVFSVKWEPCFVVQAFVPLGYRSLNCSTATKHSFVFQRLQRTKTLSMWPCTIVKAIIHCKL